MTSHEKFLSRVARPAVFLLLLFGLSMPTAPAYAELIFGLTNSNRLVMFDSAAPGTVSAPLPITGIGAETLLDIDIRPANGKLYALGSAGDLYSINTSTGAASLSAMLTGIALDPNATRFGIDFDPQTDRLRIVSNTGQNLRLTADSGVTTVDANLSGGGTGAVSVAYTNNDTNPATATTLFYIGPSTPTTTFTTSNPNSGLIMSVGALGVSSTQDVGFDVSGLSGIAFASLTNPFGAAGSALYTINLATGAASLVGSIDAGLTLRGIALSPAASVPEPSTLMLVGLGAAAMTFVARRRRTAPLSTADHEISPNGVADLYTLSGHGTTQSLRKSEYTNVD